MSVNSRTVERVSIDFVYFGDTDITFTFIALSEVQLCEHPFESPISCSVTPPAENSPKPPSNPSKTSRKPSYRTQPARPATQSSSSLSPIALLHPPISGAIMTADLLQSDSISFTCSIAGSQSYKHKYSWKWEKSGETISTGGKFTITQMQDIKTSPSSTLKVSGLHYSDAGLYSCKVKYTTCTMCYPTTGNFMLDLPGEILFKLLIDNYASAHVATYITTA